ncbi:coatomer WD associated region-domain-containing protein [Gamsiella multidivaricata]|uniref:coatomer WD associated region-domain-containing protein n=1 Tax=Gamsiella multidivaricata TaxID=101098 RepID=UPI00222092E2|nr:coatomer WD associated region-domain-containing protein [Gamsiella multidivaricata]KAI7817585.1 coatomer WD associated region-domain-containing protein [Gamsiella multidivaricata]
MKLEIKKKMMAHSERVKSMDFHPTEPWLLASLYDGHAYIWNYETQALVKTFEVSDQPVRAAKFIARKNYVIAGSDDMQLRVFNYNTHEKVHSWDAHNDYVRCIAVHPTQPYVLSGSDDMTIRLWDWEKNWRCMQTFEGHTYFVMCITINPKDTNTFASACVDGSVKIWSLGSSVANFTLDGHEKGVNWVDYYHGAEKPYLITAGDDSLVKVWDYQNKTCVQTLEGHTQNATFAVFHPELPIIISGSEDGSVKIWHANTYRLENTLNYGLNRAWTIAYSRSSNDVGLGFDLGSVVIKLGREEPTVSMDSGGKIIWAKHSDIQTANVKASIGDEIKDGDRILCAAKDLGSCEIYPQTLQHSPNGRFVVVCGDGEYIIYTALAWRNKSFGHALEFVWALDSNEYAVRESTSKVKLFKNFKEKPNLIRLNYSAEGIFGGTLLGVRSASFLNLYDWETGNTVRRIDCEPQNVYWSETGDLMTIACKDSFYVLRYNREAYSQFVEAGGQVGEEGVEEALEFVIEIPETVQTGSWVGDCFIYTNTSNRLNYLVGGQTQTIAHFDSAHYLLGYIPRDNRLYLVDKDVNVISYAISLSVIEYQTAVLRGDMDTAAVLLPRVPHDQHNRIARFLEAQEHKDLALEISTDQDHKFDLAIQLERLDLAAAIAREADSEPKWKMLGDCAMDKWRINLAEECFVHAADLSGLLLIYTSSGNAVGMKRLAEMAKSAGKSNIAFACYLSLGEIEGCIDILIETERIPEAALLARTYLPSAVPRILKQWKESLVAAGRTKTAEALADPTEYEDLFPDLQYGLQAEEAIKAARVVPVPASSYPQWKEHQYRDIISDFKSGHGLMGFSAPAEEHIFVESHGSSNSPTQTHSTDLSSSSPRFVNGSVNGSVNDDISAPRPYPSLVEERLDTISDNMSYMSLEVNTTGTGSVRGDFDFDDTSSLVTSDHDRIVMQEMNAAKEENAYESLI